MFQEAINAVVRLFRAGFPLLGAASVSSVSQGWLRAPSAGVSPVSRTNGEITLDLVLCDGRGAPDDQSCLEVYAQDDVTAPASTTRGVVRIDRALFNPEGGFATGRVIVIEPDKTTGRITAKILYTSTGVKTLVLRHRHICQAVQV